MSGIYIPGMKMPKNCITDDCPCLNGENCTCQADKEKRYVYGDRPYWCPIIELPPHGDLADKSEICLSLVHETFYSFADYNTAVGAVMNAKTIIRADIPADEEDDHIICTKASPASMGNFTKEES